jgi:tetratricopeptide (TPR) repeat protein
MDLNRRFSDNEACWLIKVETKITGPWSFNEVLMKLTQGELQPFHEASSPLDRWRSLQSQPLFSAAIERLKKQGEYGGTTTNTENTFTRTEKTSFTRTLDLSGDRPTPFSTNESVTPPPLFPDGDPSRVVPPQPLSHPPIFYKDQKKSLRPLYLGAATVLLITVIFILLPGKKAEAPSQKNQFLEFVDRGLVAKKNADWYDALTNFKKAYQINSKDVDLVFEMAPLLVQVENQTMYARNMMEKIMYGQYKKENLSIGKTILGLTYAYEKQAKLAIKQYDEVLRDDETYFPALVNKAYILFLSGNYAAAESVFSEALQGQNGNSIPYIYLIETFIFDGVKNNKRAAFEKAFNLAGQVGPKFLDGQQEIYFFQAFAAFKLNRDPSLVQAILQKALTVDPDLTAEHLHSPLVDWRGLHWSQFAFICNEFSHNLKPDVASLLDFVCTYKTNNEIAAQQAVAGWMGRSPNNPWPHIAQALVSQRLGEYEKARVSLDMAKNAGANDKFYYQTLMRVCGHLKDVSCLRKNNPTALKFSPLHAFTAKAIEGRLTGGDNKQAVYSGLRESSNYIPLIKLQ